METLKCIETRISVRKYINKPVPEKLLDVILKAGMEAPSARNLRPYKIHILKNRAKLDYIASLSPAKAMLVSCPLAILIAGRLDINPNKCYLQQDCSAVTQNMLLAAHELGLGACWLGIQGHSEFQEEMKNVFELDDNSVPISLIALGYAEVTPDPKPNRNQEEKVEVIE